MSNPRPDGGETPVTSGSPPAAPEDSSTPSGRWERTKTLMVSALALPPADRHAYLEEECGSDQELLREVESLLQFHDDAGDFIETPPVQVQDFLKAEASDSEANVGKRIGAYQIVRELGRGGMGAVYLAVRADEEFEKRVAIKLVRRGMETDLVVRRFRNERQILARLEHANIARLIDGGSTPDGLPYFIMEYVEGKPVTDYCDSKALPVQNRLEIFLKVCAAVSYAHDRNVIHRDLKPTNILVKADGNPKLLDFGIAKLVDAETGERTIETTIAGFRMMTPAYASPEQLRGEALTPVSDVFSLGVLLHELLCGRRPDGDAWMLRQYGGQTTTAALPSNSIHRVPVRDADDRREPVTPEQIAKNRSTSPEALSSELSGNLDRIILKAIRFNPTERYGSVEAMAADIRRHLSDEAITVTTSHERKSIAVLPFRILNRDAGTDEYLGLALADVLTTKLSNIPNVSVCPTSSAVRHAGADPLVAGGELGVGYVLDGRIHKSGGRVRIAVQLLCVRDHSSIWAAQFDEALDDLLKFEDSISGQVALALIPQLSGEARREIGKRQTSNAKAYQAYLKGRWYWNQNTVESLAKALHCFMESLAEDPRYASAHVGVADYYIWLGVWGGLPPAESFAAAKTSALKALEIDYALAEAHASLGFALWAADRDFTAAERELRLAIQLNPNCTPALAWLSMLSSSLGHHKEAQEYMEQASSINSASPLIAVGQAHCLYHARDFHGALDVMRSIGWSEPSDRSACERKAWCYLQLRQPEEGLLWARRAVTLSDRSPTSLCVLASALCATGNTQEARQLLAELQSRATQSYISPYLVASVQHALNNKSACLDQLERGARDSDWWVLWSANEPRFDNLRNDRRFSNLLVELGFGPRTVTAHDRKTMAVDPRILTAVAVAVLLIVAAYFGFARFRPTIVPFQQPLITKLTTNGVATHAAISPDGKYVAYSSNEHSKETLWLRQVNASGSIRLTTPPDTDISRMAFSGDGLNVSFLAASRNDPGHGILYELPVPAGSLKMIRKDVTGPASISPDGTRVVQIVADPQGHRDNMFISSADGSSEQLLASRSYPDRFSWPSTPVWSHDGKQILCAVEGNDDRGFNVNIAVIQISDRSMRIVRGPRWQFIEQANWMGDDRGIVVVGKDSDTAFQQIWFLPYPSGEARRLTNDFADYTGLTVTADSRAIVSVQMQTLTNIYILNQNDPTRPTQATLGTGRYFDLSWTSRGEVLYSSDASGTADIWIMNADGTGQRQLTSGVGRNYAPAASPAAPSVVFHSNRGGNWNLWKMNLDGSIPQQLTYGTKDSNWPRYSPDGNWIFYHHTGTDGMWNVWKVPAAGGEPQQVTPKLTMYPGVSPVLSPDGGTIACWYSEDAVKPRWKLAVLSGNGGEPLASFELPRSVFPDTPLRWTPDGKGVTYIDNRDGAGNLWIQPLDGSARHPLTNFTWGQIYSFDWSKDGRLAYSRGLSTSDVVLLRDRQRRP